MPSSFHRCLRALLLPAVLLVPISVPAAPAATEPVAAELRALPEVTGVEVGSGQVSFAGPPAALYRANLHLRCASRVLQLLGDFAYAGADELYEAARGIAWEEFLSPEATMAVSARGLGPGIDNSMYAALRVKDAVCDRFRARFGARPDVDVQQPMVRINVQLYSGPTAEARCALSLDSSDPPLHHRGYRHSGGEAPLKETLAAAILAHTGYPDRCSDAAAAGAASAPELPPLVDLCCGSGTLLCEGGLRALRVAPGLPVEMSRCGKTRRSTRLSREAINAPAGSRGS